MDPLNDQLDTVKQRSIELSDNLKAEKAACKEYMGQNLGVNFKFDPKFQLLANKARLTKKMLNGTNDNLRLIEHSIGAASRLGTARGTAGGTAGGTGEQVFTVLGPITVHYAIEQSSLSKLRNNKKLPASSTFKLDDTQVHRRSDGVQMLKITQTGAIGPPINGYIKITASTAPSLTEHVTQLDGGGKKRRRRKTKKTKKVRKVRKTKKTRKVKKVKKTRKKSRRN